MAFPTGSLNDHLRIGAGECYPDTLVQTAKDFEDQLVIGLFAKWESGELHNIDGSATPTIAGVVMRDVANAVEDGGVYDASLYTQVDYAVHNHITVTAVDGLTPSEGDAMYVENQTPAEYGKVTTVSTGNVDANAVFVKSIDGANNVWQIRLK